MVENKVHYVEIVTPDFEAVCDLHKESYGWDFKKVPELGNAMVAELPGGLLYGIRAPLQPEEQPTVRTYLRVKNLGSAVQKAREMGAEILLERMEISGRGMIAIYSHGGIDQGIWQVS